nr:hypothetical protein [Streptomyces sp. SID5468]
MTPAPAPARIGQGTAVEQSRAAAEVQAAVVVAQQCPRDVQRAIAEMGQVCGNPRLAEKAFYSYPKGKTTVTGPSVFLARELARIWGNMQHGLIEMRRDDQYGESEMQAFAWDVEKNSRVSTTFIVPHKRDKRGGPEKLTELRDIYENNTNNGARRVRQAIFAVLPDWFVEDAIETCRRTLRDGGGVPLPMRIANAVARFETLGVTGEQLKTRVGRPSGRWTEHDVVELGILFQSIERREVTVEEAFPARQVTAAEITASTTAPQAATEPAAGHAPAAEWPQVAQPGSGAAR